MTYLRDLPEQRFEMLILIVIIQAIVIAFLLVTGYLQAKSAERKDALRKMKFDTDEKRMAASMKRRPNSLV